MVVRGARALSVHPVERSRSEHPYPTRRVADACALLSLAHVRRDRPMRRAGHHADRLTRTKPCARAFSSFTRYASASAARKASSKVGVLLPTAPTPTDAPM